VKLVLDASMALAWCITRNDPSEAALAQEALNSLRMGRALVPALWYAEILNSLLVFERANRLSSRDSANYLNDLATLWIELDDLPADRSQRDVLSTARLHQLTAYDATYLELALRTPAPLATFDRKLAAACRSAGGHVFGD
jgi:predicted nucleic acid-binding protein